MKNIIASFLAFFGSLFASHNNLNQQATSTPITPVAQVQVSINTSQNISTSSSSGPAVSPTPVPSTPSITVLSPNASSISLGQTIPLAWKTSGLSSSAVSIYLHDDTKQCKPGWVGCWIDFGIGGTSNSNYSWNTSVNMFGDAGPNSVSLGNLQNDKLRIKVCDSTTGQICGYSPEFTVLSSTSASVN